MPRIIITDAIAPTQCIMKLQTGQDSKLKYEIRFPSLPLAVYREISAHLRQVDGVETGLYPQISQQFDYNQSQVGGLWIGYAPTTGLESRELVDQILAYYQNLYGALEVINS